MQKRVENVLGGGRIGSTFYKLFKDLRGRREK